jgi:hypothetical protein
MSKTSVTNLAGLVLGCIEADVFKGNTPAAAFFSTSSRVAKLFCHFSKRKNCFQQFVEFFEVCQMFEKFKFRKFDEIDKSYSR